MDKRLEELYAKDEFLQSKIKELAQLKSELIMMNNPGMPNFDNFYVTNEKEENDAEATKKDALLKKLGKANYESLIKVFMKYSCAKDYHNSRKIDNLSFHRFMEDALLYTVAVSKVNADLMFYKNKQSKTIDFWSFVEILIKLARVHFTTEKKYQGLLLLITQKIIPNLKLDQEAALYLRYHQIFQEQPITALLQNRKPTLKIIFNIYKSSNSVDMDLVPIALRSKKKGTKVERIPRITVKGFINFLTAFEFLPELISSMAASKLFRAVPCPVMFNECLDYKEFTEACVYVALHIYENESYRDFCRTPLEYLEMWFKFLDAHPKPLIENPNPLRNTVYTLQQSVDFS